jgi:predicted neuraminidase
VEQQFVFERAPFASCHAATITALDDGSLVAAWFAGTREGDPDVGIWMATRAPSDERWSPPRLVADVDGVACWNPVVHATRAGELLLFYKAGSHPQTWSGFVRRSDDGGATWAPPEPLPAGILGPVKNKPVEAADGTLICGSSVESYRAWGCWVERTPDAGRTWTKHGPINVAGHLHGAIQPALVADGDRVVMLCRTRRLGHVVRAESADGGCTWTDLAATDRPHNNSGLDAVRLADGRTVLVYNHTTAGRTPLNVAVSPDLGVSWTAGPVLEDEPGEFSYPAVVQAGDGTVHIAYTWNRRRIRHATLSPADLPEPART